MIFKSAFSFFQFSALLRAQGASFLGHFACFFLLPKKLLLAGGDFRLPSATRSRGSMEPPSPGSWKARKFPTATATAWQISWKS